MDATLRPGTPEDAQACGAVCYRSFKELAQGHGFEPDFPSPEVAAGLLGELLAHPGFYADAAEIEGPAPIYKLATLLWLHGHGGAAFEVWADLSPTAEPGGLAMRGRVPNWALISNGRPVFTKDVKLDSSFTAHEQRLVARAAGQVSSLPRRTRQDPTKPVHAKLGPWTAPNHSGRQDGASTSFSSVQGSEAV